MAAVHPEAGLSCPVHRQPGPGPPAQRAARQLLHGHLDVQPGDPAQLLGHHLRLELTLHPGINMLEVATATAAGA